MITDVLTTLDGALKDNVTGLAARAAIIRAAMGLGVDDVQIDYFFQSWVLSGEMKQAAQPNVAVSPTDGSVTLKVPPENLRFGAWSLNISYETFIQDPTAIANNVTVTLAALLQVLDTLREYSDAHGGTVDQVREPVPLRMGQFAGSATNTNGFTVTATIDERGTT